MTIYIITCSHDYEGSENEGVTTDLQVAIDRRADLRENALTNCRYDIQVWEDGATSCDIYPG
jgi:hypothetical protein